MMKKLTALMLMLVLLTGSLSARMEVIPEATAESEARQALIDGIIASAKGYFDRANGRAQRAQYAGDIYVCKNFTVRVFKDNSAAFAIAQYPDKELIIPDNLSAKASKPLRYGIFWQDVPAEEGNPFEAAYSFVYSKELSKAENREKALTFMREVKRGDFFQMAADYYYGVGAHSLVFIANYDAANNEVCWTDSNMKGKKVGGLRYGYVQYDASKKTDWFVDAFCRPGAGATLYRLREDIIRR
jgi:hypothetical protein